MGVAGEFGRCVGSEADVSLFKRGVAAALAGRLETVSGMLELPKIGGLGDYRRNLRFVALFCRYLSKQPINAGFFLSV